MLLNLLLLLRCFIHLYEIVAYLEGAGVVVVGSSDAKSGFMLWLAGVIVRLLIITLVFATRRVF